MEKQIVTSLVTLLWAILFLVIGIAGILMANVALMSIGFCIGALLFIGGLAYTITAFQKEVK